MALIYVFSRMRIVQEEVNKEKILTADAQATLTNSKTFDRTWGKIEHDQRKYPLDPKFFHSFSYS